MQAISKNVKFTEASTPVSNTVKTVKANAKKSDMVQMVKANQYKFHTSKSNITFMDMVTKRNQYQNTDNIIKDTKNISEAKQEVKKNTVSQSEGVSLESMLKEKYPNLKYHVFDASSSYWRTRNDYPHYLLYQDNIDTEALENWKPSGENPFYGSIDGRFTAPKEIKALSSVPVGTTAVVIHPKVQEKMDKDPEYAKEIMKRIETWFTFDNLRNEAMMPGITARSSQCVAIGENGEIVNAQSHSSGGGFSQSKSESGTDAAIDFWTKRSLRHKYFMQLQLEGQLRHEMLLYGLTGTPKSSGLFDLVGGTLSTANLTGLINLAQSFESFDMPSLSTQQMTEKAEAKSKLAAMMNSGELTVLGSSIAGVPFDSVITMTKQHVWGNEALTKLY